MIFFFYITVIGSRQVGKTSLLLKYKDDSFNSTLAFIGNEFVIKMLNIENKLIKLQMWDTRYISKMNPINKSHYKGINGIIIMYDVNNKYNFECAKNYLKQLEQLHSTACKVLIGNKIDEPNREVSFEEGEKLAKEFNIGSFEISVKTNENVNELLNYLTVEMMKKNPKSIKLDNNVKIKQKKCSS